MTLSRFRVALVLPLAFGCAHAVYDGQPDLSDTDNSVTDQPVTSGAGSGSVVNSLPGTGSTSGAAGSPGIALSSGGASDDAGGGTGFAGATSGGAGKSGSAGAASSAAGASVGGATGGAGAPTSSGGAHSAGAPNAGAPSAGAPSAGAPSGGDASGGGSSAGCSGVPTWMLKTYAGGDQVQAGGKLYKCKSGAEHGWCGLADAYAPVTGYAWADAWILVGPC